MGTAPSRSAATIGGEQETKAPALAVRTVGVFAVTSTMRAAPASSRWVRRICGESVMSAPGDGRDRRRVAGAVGDAVGGRCTTAGLLVRDGGRWRQLAAIGPGGAGQGDEPDLVADADGGRPGRHDGQGLCGGQ